MERVWIESFEFHLKFALRNLKSAILPRAMLLALSFPATAQQIARIGQGQNHRRSCSTVDPCRQGRGQRVLVY